MGRLQALPSAHLQWSTWRALPVTRRLSGASVDEVQTTACGTCDRLISIDVVAPRRRRQADLHVRSRLGAAKNESFHRLKMTDRSWYALICLNSDGRRIARGYAGKASGQKASGQTMRDLGHLQPISDIGGRHRARLGCTERCVDLRLHAACGESGEPRLGSSSLHLIAELVAPFPNVRFGSRYDRILDTSVDHGTPL